MYSSDIPIILAYSGVIHNSGEVHKVLREKYLSGDEFLIEKYDELGEISWKSRYAMMRHNWAELGKLFTRNSEISE